jgi:acyl-CoA thioester hydrolase
MTTHVISARVYWEDTDASGLVYHTSYVRFMERGRTELLRGLGLEQSKLLDGAGGAPIFFVVRAMQLDFRKPAVLDDFLAIETRPLELGGASLTLDQRVTRGGETLVAATVKVVCVESGRARRMPADVREKFERLMRGSAVARNPNP